MKKKTLQKISRLFASLVLVGAMSLGTVAPVNAANADGSLTWTETQTAEAALTVEYKMGKNVPTPTTTFTYEFTKQSFNSETTTTVKNNMPDITAKTVNFTVANGTDLSTDDTYKLVKGQTTNFLADFAKTLKESPASTNGVGIYQYKVSQKIPSSITPNNTLDTLFESKVEYTVNIYVAQKADKTGLYIKGLVVTQSKDESGNESTGSGKIDATPNPHPGTGNEPWSGMVFKNEYLAKNDPGSTVTPDPVKPATYAFMVKNNIKENADTTESNDFKYSMTLTAPGLTNAAGKTFTYYVYKNGTLGSVQTGTYGTAITDITLGKNDCIFIKECFYGSKVEVKQEGRASWTSTATRTFNNTKDTSDLTVDMGKDLTATGTIGKSDNSVVYNNSYKSVAVTGIIVNNFPFVMMIVMAMAAFVAIVAVKSRRRMNER